MVGKQKKMLCIRKHCQLLSEQVVSEEAIWNDGGSDGGRVEGR